MSREDLEQFRQRLQRIRIKAEETATNLRAFEQEILKMKTRAEKEPPNNWWVS
jgi:predicted  nucleic acid-binding Zn-ribbon protein